MLTKNLYTRLSLNEIIIYSNIYTFFIIKDSYFFPNMLNFSKLKVFNKLVSKGILKNTLFLDHLNIKTLKFPVFFYFFTEHFFFENLFLNFFSKNNTFLFLKFKNKLFFFKEFFNTKNNSPKQLYDPSQISLTTPFNFFKFHMYSKI